MGVQTADELLRIASNLQRGLRLRFPSRAAVVAGRFGEGLSAMVTLRPWGTNDLWLLRDTLGNPVMMEHLGGVESSEKIEQRHARFLKSGEMFTVCEGRTVVGSVGYWDKAWRDEDVYETGWMILPIYAGRGLATQAARAVISLARDERRHRFLHAFPNVENAASNAVCRKAGFTKLGEYTFEYPKGSWMRCNDWRVDLHAHG